MPVRKSVFCYFKVFLMFLKDLLWYAAGKESIKAVFDA